jgi:hypothetical protein
MRRTVLLNERITYFVKAAIRLSNHARMRSQPTLSGESFTRWAMIARPCRSAANASLRSLDRRYTLALASLLQRKGDIAKLSPTARIEKLRFRVFEMMKFHFHRIGLSRGGLHSSSRSAEYWSMNILSGKAATFAG